MFENANFYVLFSLEIIMVKSYYELDLYSNQR